MVSSRLLKSVHKNPIKIKLTKKWAFWKRFKYFFFKKPNIGMFTTLKKIFNQKSILFEHFSNLLKSEAHSINYEISGHDLLYNDYITNGLTIFQQPFHFPQLIKKA